MYICIYVFMYVHVGIYLVGTHPVEEQEGALSGCDLRSPLARAGPLDLQGVIILA